MGWFRSTCFEQFDGQTWKKTKVPQTPEFSSFDVISSFGLIYGLFNEKLERFVYHTMAGTAHQGFPWDASTEVAAEVDQLFLRAVEELIPSPQGLCWISIEDLLQFEWLKAAEDEDIDTCVVYGWLADLSRVNQKGTWRVISWWNPQ